MTIGRSAIRLLLLAIGLGLTASLGIAVWFSTPQPAAGVPTGRSSAGSVGVALATGPPAGTSAKQLPTITASGSSAGFDVSVQLNRTGVAPNFSARLDIRLSTEATPASAPTASAVLTGSRVRKLVPLSMVGAGHWISGPFAIASGRYTLSSRFDRSGGPVTVPVTLVLP